MTNTFITVEEAKTLIEANCRPLEPVQLAIENALHNVLAEDIYSPIDMPGFNQSSMDGYAIAYKDLASSTNFKVNGESFAGNTQELLLETRSAARIFTGAPLPSNADTVVMQEQVTRTGDTIVVDFTNLLRGANLRKKGAETNKGELAMQKGELLTPAAIGFLAGLGITRVSVYPFPSVTIITTGTEIVKPGTPLQFGQVYESNSYSLSNALKNIHVANVSSQTAPDDLLQLEQKIYDAINCSDIVLLTGGVSVGDYDLVPPALANCGVETIFYKVKQRPGKPLLFGIKNHKLAFGLPGNPCSVLSCFYHYVLPAIQHLMCRSTPFIETRTMRLKHAFEKQIPLTQFLKGRYQHNEVSYLGAQESFRLSSFAVANCLIEIPADKKEVAAGELVKVHVL